MLYYNHVGCLKRLILSMRVNVKYCCFLALGFLCACGGESSNPVKGPDEGSVLSSSATEPSSNDTVESSSSALIVEPPKMSSSSSLQSSSSSSLIDLEKIDLGECSSFDKNDSTTWHITVAKGNYVTTFFYSILGPFVQRWGTQIEKNLPVEMCEAMESSNPAGECTEDGFVMSSKPGTLATVPSAEYNLDEAFAIMIENCLALFE